MAGLFHPRSASLGLSGPPLFGPLWASSTSQPAAGSLVAIPPASQPASSLVVILLVGRPPGRNSACRLVAHNFACEELPWLLVGRPWVCSGFLFGSPRGFLFGFVRKETCGEPPWSQICLWGASSQARDRLVLSTLRLSGPLWASLGLSQPASQPPSQPASQAQDRLPGRNSASQPASQFPGRNSACG